MYNPADWYWSVGDKSPTTQVYSSRVVKYLSLDNSDYKAWINSGNSATKIDLESSLKDVLSNQYPAGWVKTQFTPLDFMMRFTPAEQGAMATTAQSNASALLVLIQFAGAQYVDLTDPRTSAGIEVFKTAGVLSSARATAILTP